MSVFNLNAVKEKLSLLEYIKFKIFLSLLLIGYLRALYFIGVFIKTGEYNHFYISILGAFFTTFFVTYIFKWPKKTYLVLHGGIIVTFIGMMYRIIYIDSFLITQIQTTFLIIMWSFYGLGKKYGTFYSLLFTAVLPLHILFNGYNFELFPPSNEPNFYITWIIFSFNIIITIYVPYLYQGAVSSGFQKINKLNNNLQKSIESNKDFTSIITHELRTPLNAVIGIASLLKDKSTEKEQKEDLITLQNSAEYLLSLINQTLEFNKMNINVSTIEYSDIDITQTIHTYLDKHQSLYNQSISTRVNISQSLKHKLIRTDTIRLNAAITNLMHYFLKNSPINSTIEIDVSIFKKNILTNKTTLKFSIKNKATTIKADKLKKIFEPFSKTVYFNNSMNNETGLELPIAKKAIENLGTKIEIINTSASGLNLNFELDTKIVDKSTELKVAKTIDSSKKTEDLKILLVDDNEINNFLMTSLLNHWALNSQAVDNGIDAIEIVKKNQINIVLMDLHMPGISGFEASKQIRALGDTIVQPYIIAVSAVNEDEITEYNLIDYGINDFIAKPIKNEILKSKIMQYNLHSEN